MRQEIKSRHEVDGNGMPAGGMTDGKGFWIQWQDGPLGPHHRDCIPGQTCHVTCARLQPNGAFVEGVIEAAVDRIRFYQTIRGGEFACDANAAAIEYLEAALRCLDERTAAREARGVEGTHVA